MKKGIIWFLVSCITVTATILAACAPAQPPAPAPSPKPAPSPAPAPSPLPTPSPTPAPSTDKPKYGGTIIDTSTSFPVWDVFGPSSLPAGATYEGLMQEDWYLPESVRPSQQTYYAGNEKVVTGALAESWEMTGPQDFVFHIRKGVRFQNKPPVNGRELTSADVKWSFETCLAAPLTNKGMLTIIDNITCPDKYTVDFHTAQPRTSEFMYGAFIALHVSNGGQVAPREVIDTYGKNGFADWKNANGTGPWIATDYIAGSSYMFKKNPEYWAFDKNYPENRLPYADRFQILYILDPSTCLAAIRTGKLDRYIGVKWDQADSLLKTSPWLKMRTFQNTGIASGAFRFSLKPFSDIRVRQAMQIAIDQDAIIKGVYNGHAVNNLYNWPYNRNSDLAMKPEEYPQIIRDMFFGHNIAQAKKLLADAGYPNGFKTEIIGAATDVDITSLCAAYWADIGVQVDIKVMDSTAKSAIMYKHDFPGMAWHSTTGATAPMNPSMYLTNRYLPESILDYGGYDDPVFRDMLERVQKIQDYSARVKLYKEIGVKVMVDAPYFFVPSTDLYFFWAPWLKGYWGQYGTATSLIDYSRYVWLDQDLKKSIIGQ